MTIPDDSLRISFYHMLHNEIIKNEGKKMAAMFTLMKNESASYRVQAVNYDDDMDTPDENTIEALVKTLNNDKNVDVRMAAT